MLTDIFAERYARVRLWDRVTAREQKLIVQGFRLLSEQICPFYVDGKEHAYGKSFWTELHSRLSMELGVKSLSPLAYAFPTTFNGKPHTQTGMWPMVTVCENWMLQNFQLTIDDPDRFVKERLSLLELGFRMRATTVSEANAKLEPSIADLLERLSIKRHGGPRLPGNPADGMRAANRQFNDQFRSTVDELNVRLKQAETGLHYHNGFIQRAADPLTTDQVEAPFWLAVADPKWANVDIDMKEALDLRDSGGRDPAFYAARALESTIKIISGEKGWTRGGEKGAHNFIDNLAAKGNAFIAGWEAESLKGYFTKVRNPFGHGPGQEPMPTLSAEQTDWAIETAMSWVKSLIRRFA
jgi:hypothetical protein